ncbi:MAG: Stk1 family PASTA domain-containing Ser/Thr kinase [Candidatus Limivivens sp.]|nr:Stk1 family PASTA domain-containing Ser/Thr kinase [Candidatus Limivivens sp.]
MLKEGVLIQDRYEIISRIGSGGMADVYKAKDQKLNRFVAVKVLKQEFREDKAFITKFRAEAQSAAGLAHPNIVNVYDVGEDHNVYFIVMELVEGITLKEYIEKKGRLSVREATSVAIQVSMGLEAAHRNHIVHRDVKPQNIIISTDGKVKVTDFGIARAATTNTISSSVMGSVHYSSPEQARGGYSDYKSDIYSLGITMYEMVTGHVPFDGDSTVAIAIKHLQEEMQSPRRYVPDLPLSLEQIIMKCTQKSPDRRYNNMDELIRDLKESLVNPNGNFVQIAPVRNTDRTVVISKSELEQIQGGRTEAGYPQEESREPGYGNYAGGYQQEYGNGYQQEHGNGYQQGQSGQGQLYGTEPGYQRQGRQENYGRYGSENTRGKGQRRYEEEEDDDDYRPIFSKFITIGSVIIGVLILAIVVVLVGNAAGFLNISALRNKLLHKNTGTPQTQVSTEMIPGTETLETIGTLVGETEKMTEHPGEAIVPDVKGKTPEQAETILRDKGFTPLNGGEQASAAYGAGLVAGQNPAYGSSVTKGSTVTYYVSSGAADVPVPDVAGKPEAEATAALQTAGLTVNLDYYYNANVPVGYVIYTNPQGGTSVKAGSAVTVYVCREDSQSGSADPGQGQTTDPNQGGTPSADAPDYTGQSAEEAVSTLSNSGYVVETISEINPDVPYGTIIRQTISGNTITLVVSLGAGDLPDTNSETDGMSEGESEDGTGNLSDEPQESFACNTAIGAPDDYDGEPVRIVVEQGSTQKTLVDGSAVKFPYTVKVTSGSEEKGNIILYILDPDTYDVTATVTYPQIVFKAES